MSGSSRSGVRRSPIAWVLMGVAALVMIALGASRPDADTTSPERVLHIAKQLRCLQCNGENVASSAAPIAIDMRAEISSQIDDGKTDDEVLSYFADRYQREVLLVPTGDGAGAVLWTLPLVVAAVSVGALWFVLDRRRVGAAPVEVSEAERAAVAEARARRAGGGGDGPRL